MPQRGNIFFWFIYLLHFYLFCGLHFLFCVLFLLFPCFSLRRVLRTPPPGPRVSRVPLPPLPPGAASATGCVQLTAGAAGQWSTVDCGTSLPFICQQPAANSAASVERHCNAYDYGCGPGGGGATPLRAGIRRHFPLKIKAVEAFFFWGFLGFWGFFLKKVIFFRAQSQGGPGIQPNRGLK